MGEESLSRLLMVLCQFDREFRSSQEHEGNMRNMHFTVISEQIYRLSQIWMTLDCK